MKFGSGGRGRAICLIACGFVLLGAVGGLVGADRDARVITPEGSPVWLDPWHAYLFDSPAVVVIVENHHTAAVSGALRVWIFDPGLRLKGSVDYCTTWLLERGTKGRTLVPVEIPGISIRDRAVVAVAAVGSGRLAWTLREDDTAQVSAARAAVEGRPGRLVLVRTESAPQWSCACDPRETDARCEGRCRANGVAAATALLLPDGGCSATCACR